MSVLQCFCSRARFVSVRQFSASFTRFKKVKTYHEILGVPRSSTKEQIKEAFFEKSKLIHPDTNTGDEEKFRELKTAYEYCLSFTKQPDEMTYNEIEAKEREDLLETKRNVHSPFIIENFIEYTIILILCFVISQFVAHGMYKFHPVSEGLASYDLSVEGEEKRTAIKRRIAQLEQEEYEWQAKQKQTH
ncbi:uncharacterized protein LOC125650889 [Ostrea edulis]|uniref:uncharacterized protein LOC125650889 n=1 Tax=Ostrea edulis TaxID=37623 RepID=UPI002095B123|nr:uncharacterized protein LOC125650889 [Ostrea edulis]